MVFFTTLLQDCLEGTTVKKLARVTKRSLRNWVAGALGFLVSKSKTLLIYLRGMCLKDSCGQLGSNRLLVIQFVEFEASNLIIYEN